MTPSILELEGPIEAFRVHHRIYADSAHEYIFATVINGRWVSDSKGYSVHIFPVHDSKPLGNVRKREMSERTVQKYINLHNDRKSKINEQIRNMEQLADSLDFADQIYSYAPAKTLRDCVKNLKELI